MCDPNEVDFDAVVNDIDAVSGNGLDIFEDEDNVSTFVEIDSTGEEVGEVEDLDVVGSDALGQEPITTPAIVVTKTESKMDVAKRIFAEEVEKAKPNKQVRKTVIDRFIAEGNFGKAYAATAYQQLTKK